MGTAILERSRASTLGLPCPAHRSVGVLVVDEDAWLRTRVCRVLETESGFRLAGVADNAGEAMSIGEREEVDVVVIGHRVPSPSALRLCRQLERTPSPPAVLICAAWLDGVLAACCVVAEADALLSRYDSDAELSVVIGRIASGERVLPAVMPRVGAMLHGQLDPAELAIFGMLLAGIPASDVAQALRMSRSELESRRSAMLGTLEMLPPTSGIGY